MTKAQIHFSNHLEILVEELKANLFPKGAGPFEKRLIAVPHLGLKAYLMQAIAKDPDMQVAAGLQIANLSQTWTKITKKVLPTALELSLFLQHSLIPMIEKEEELARYFGTQAREKRVGPFCDALAQYFQWYSIYGKQALSSWQESLWKKVTDRWVFPTDKIKVHSNWQVHLFGFSFIQESYFRFFQSLDAKMYLFSPCAIFWGDFYSDKEQNFLAKEVPEGQLDFFEESFEEQHPLLANWGRVGRKMLIMAEESNLLSEEHYVEPSEQNCLHKVQKDFLEGYFEKREIDESISVYSAVTPLREVEILKDQLLHLFETEEIAPRDVQVFAPDITIYAPYIHAAFSHMAYAIADLETGEVDPVAKALRILVGLPKKRFALENVLQLFSAPPFQEKFGLNIGRVRKWLTLANVRWGFSKKERRVLYLQDAKEEQILANTEEGTWERGLQRLLLGLGQIEGSGAPLCAVEVTEIEGFNRLYTLIHSLADDLAPLYDGTKWTIPTWLRYFGCLLESYFAIDPTEDLYKQLQQLAASCDRLDGEEVPFSGVERVLEQLLGKKGKTHLAPHLQAVRFGSLSEGCVLPGKVICLIGMQEEAFPGREEKASLYVGELDYRPKKTEQDRYLFLQTLLSARKSLFMSYVRDAEGKWGASPLVDELLSHLEGSEVVHHPADPFNPVYFQAEEEQLRSYSQEQFAIAKAKVTSERRSPLITDFYERIALEPPSTHEREVDIQKLFKFARHPLRYYFHEVLGIYPDYSSKPDQGEYLLDPLAKYHLVREAIQTPLEEVLERAKGRGELPLHLLEPLAKKQIAKEVEEWQSAMEVFGVAPEEIFSKQVDLTIGKTRLVGKIDFCTPKGLLVRGKDCLEDRIRFCPQGLVMKELGLLLLPIKEEEPLVIEGDLEKYLDYFFLATKHPSPLLPQFAKSLLEGDSEDLKKQLKQVEDEVFSWLFFRDPMPRAQVIFDNWSEYLRELFGRVDATV